MAKVTLSKEEWKQLESSIGLYDSQKMKIDGREITIMLQAITRRLQLKYMIFVNGVFSGKSYINEDENCLKFGCKKKVTGYWTPKRIKETEKIWGKKVAHERFDFSPSYIYIPYFSSFRNLKNTFEKNNESIVWVRE